MKKILFLIILTGTGFHAEAMTDATQAVVATSAAGLINIGSAIYMQQQGMNPQFVVTPNGMTVVTGTAASQPIASSGNTYQTQNQQADKQAFFEGN